MSPDVEPFHAIAISRLAHSLEMQGRPVIHLEFGQPSAGAPRKAIAAAQRILSADPLGYWESPALKSRLARHYRDVYGLEVDPDRFVLTCGTSPALVLALATKFAPGDQIALARPGYVAYRNTVKALYLSPLEIACGPESRYQLTASRIAGIDPPPKGLIIASPANPTGTIISPSELAKIADVCRERGIRVISDEVYHGLSFGEPTRSMLEFDPEATVVSSLSKYFSMPGWRLGWILAPSRDLTRVRAYAGNMFLSAPSISQHAGLAALDCREELQGHIEGYRRNRDLLLAAMPRLGLGNVAPPDGAFYLYIDVSHLTSDSLAFCRKLLQDTGVAMAPGVDFDPIDGGRFVRMSFAVSTAQVEDAVSRLASWLRALTGTPV